MTIPAGPAAMLPVLSHYQTSPLLAARERGLTSFAASIDLGITSMEVTLTSDHIIFPDSSILNWQSVEKINSRENACFYIRDNTANPIRGFSELLGRAYSLMPTPEAPVLVAAGFPMHRFKNITPLKAALAMVEPVMPIHGKVLDTATGLGYTAVVASKTASAVITIELCPVAQEMARMNPWSQSLFDNPKISRIIGDSLEEIGKFPDNSFAAVIHDPPTMALTGDLYSGEFYKQAFRVLHQRGRMFHYIGDPDSAAGSRVARGVVKRLHDAGFGKVISLAKAFGVVAYK
jgi:predicted methyltransferase